MGQVPRKKNPKYLLVGSGRLAQHLQKYFLLSQLDLQFWSRNNNPNFNSLSPQIYPDARKRLIQTVQNVSHILLAISDRSLASFLWEYPELREKTLVHFSGAAQVDKIYPCHPLMTFGVNLYSFETYLNVPCVTEKGCPSFHQLFPQLLNPSFHLEKEKRSLYHAYCALAGNFTSLLWQYVEKRFEKDLQLPAEALLSYKAQVFENTLRSSEKAFTGPLSRGDVETIEKHLQVLRPESRNLYQNFISLFQYLQNDETELPTKDNSNEY